MQAVRGVGVDIVDLGAFAASLAEPGTRFARAFSPTERRQSRDRAAARRPGPAAEVSSSSDPAPSGTPAPDVARHLAARWAAKEAVVKAWSAALYGAAPPIAPDLLDWSEIETVCDAWGRPAVRLRGEVAAQFTATVGESARLHISLSHDGGSAMAFVVLEAPAAD